MKTVSYSEWVDTGSAVKSQWRWLPRGTWLPSRDWQARQRLLLALAWANVPLLAIVGTRADVDLWHLALELAGVVALLLAVPFFAGRTSKAILVSVALVSCSGLLVHLTNGLIESHFHFFVVVPLISLYRDWRPLALGLAYVFIHHSVVGVLDPASVFNHPAALDSPVLWAGIHALYVLALTAVILAYWRFSESVEGALAEEEALRRGVEAEKLKIETERLATLVRSKDEFVASVSHELRTPLAAVMGFAEVLRDQDVNLSVEERRELVVTIAQEAYDLAGIVDDLLVAARAEIDAVHISKVPVDIGANCAQVVEVLPEAERVRITVTRAPDPVKALADPVRVRQVVRNLITNAIRYGGDHVEIAYEARHDTVCVSVSDDGREIPEDERERIFLPYSVAHDPGSQPSSVGLGLTVSRQLAEMMGGGLSYRYDGERSIFEMDLPLADPEAHDDNAEKEGAKEPLPIGAST